MRHLKAHRKLGRDTEHRISLLRNLATSLINSREKEAQNRKRAAGGSKKKKATETKAAETSAEETAGEGEE